jgi:outer membrane protein assembly factor BamB
MHHVVRIALADDHVFALTRTTLTCVEYLTGTVRWKVEADGDTLLVDDGMAFVGSSGTVACYSTVDGSRLWKDEYEGLGMSAVALGVPGNVLQAER